MNEPHPCNQDPFDVCACGRVGTYAFGPNTSAAVAEQVESVFEFVEALPASKTFTTLDALDVPGVRYGTAPKVLRIMEHHELIRRVGRANAQGRPIVYRRAKPVGALVVTGRNRGWSTC